VREKTSFDRLQLRRDVVHFFFKSGDLTEEEARTFVRSTRCRKCAKRSVSVPFTIRGLRIKMQNFSCLCLVKSKCVRLRVCCRLEPHCYHADVSACAKSAARAIYRLNAFCATKQSKGVVECFSAENLTRDDDLLLQLLLLFTTVLRFYTTNEALRLFTFFVLVACFFARVTLTISLHFYFCNQFTMLCKR